MFGLFKKASKISTRVLGRLFENWDCKSNFQSFSSSSNINRRMQYTHDQNGLGSIHNFIVKSFLNYLIQNINFFNMVSLETK